MTKYIPFIGLSSRTLLNSVILFYGCVSLFSKEATTFYYQEPLVKEGNAYEMNCTHNISHHDWYINWLYANGTAIGLCNQRAGTCFNVGNNNNNATLMEADTHITSRLRISNVTWIHRGLVYVCKAFEKIGNRTQTLGEWKMSRTYHPPRAPPKCDARLNDGQTIHLSCQADIVYPGIVCEIFQLYNAQETWMHINMTYEKRELQHGYFSVNCSVIIFPIHHGDYSFCVNITSEIDFEQPDLETRTCTQNVSIKDTPTVRIFNNTNVIAVCPGKQETLTVRCELLWWPVDNISTFSWYLDNKQIHTHISQMDSHKSIIESVYAFTPDYEDHKKLLMCRVSETVNATTEINLTWPPSKPPELVYKRQKKVNQTTAAEEDTINVECTAEEGEPPISKVILICRKSDTSEVARIEQINKADVTYVFQNNINCSCTVQHISQCTVPSANINFGEVTWSEYSLVTIPTDGLKREEKEYLIYYIGIAFVGLIGLGAMIALIFYWRTRCQESNTCIGSFFRKIELSNHASLSSFKSKKSIKEEEPYSVVDIVDQCSEDSGRTALFIQAYSNQHQSSVHSLSNHFPLSKRALPALPPHSSFYCSTKITEHRSGMDVIDPAHGGKYLTNRSMMETSVEYKECLQHEEPPPLPPKPLLNENQRQVPDIPIYTTNSILKLNTCKKSKPVTSNYNAFNKVPANSSPDLSVPRRRPPPTPCGCKSNVRNLKTNREHRFPVLHGASETTVKRGKEGPSTVSSVSRNTGQLKSELSSNGCPPPPFKARKKITGNQTSGSKHLETVAMLPSKSELAKDWVKNTELGDMVKTYNNVNTKFLHQEQHSSLRDHFLHDEKETRSDSEIDECSESSLLSRGLSSSTTSASTVINGNCNDLEPNADIGLL